MTLKNRLVISVTISPDALAQIDEVRKNIPRSRFIEDTIMGMIKNGK